MGSSTNTLTIRVPAVLKKRIEKVSVLQGVSINQFALYAFTKEIAELEKQSYFDAILSKINKKQLMRAAMRSAPRFRNERFPNSLPGVTEPSSRSPQARQLVELAGRHDPEVPRPGLWAAAAQEEPAAAIGAVAPGAAHRVAAGSGSVPGAVPASCPGAPGN